MAVRIYKLSDLSYQQIADVISEGVAQFDTVAVDGSSVTISDADGNLVLKIEDLYGRFYTLDGTNLVSTESNYFKRDGYIGVCRKGIIINNASRATYALSKSQHGQYAFITTPDNGGTAKCVSQSSLVAKEYSFGGTADDQTLLMFFPLAVGTYEFDCTKNLCLAEVYQTDNYRGLTIVDGKEYLQIGRIFMIDN